MFIILVVFHTKINIKKVAKSIKYKNKLVRRKYTKTMIQRTTLPNLAISKPKQNKNIQQMELTKTSQIGQTKKHYQNSQRYYSTKKTLKTQNKLKTQVSINSQKLLQNTDMFHTKIKFRRQKSSYQNQIASYFFKIHNGLNILQNNEDLKRKLNQSRKEQTQRLRTASIQNSKKKLEKKLIINSKNGTQSVDSFSEKKHPESLKEQSIIYMKKKINNQLKTEQSQLTSISSTLQNRKKQLTENAKSAKYSFEHFNSGEIFTQIALINENKLLLNQNTNTYLIDEHQTYANKMYSLSDKKKQKIKKLLQEQFRDEYNSFLRKKLPSTFGQNGNKSCIYQQYVLKRKQQQQNSIKSKLVEGKFLRTEPSLPQKEEFIFTNQIKNISAKKILMDKAFVDKLDQQQSKVHKYITDEQKIRPGHSATTSKMVTNINTKLNTLRQGQTFINKLKLKKLAKMQEKEKAKSFHKNRQLKSRKKSHHQHSSLSNYENSLSEAEMSKLMQKSNLILGKHLSINISNPQVSINHKLSANKNQSGIGLNEFEEQHLSNVNKLLSKQQSILRKQRQDLDCLPWRIAIKLQKRRDL